MRRRHRCLWVPCLPGQEPLGGCSYTWGPRCGRRPEVECAAGCGHARCSPHHRPSERALEVGSLLEFPRGGPPGPADFADFLVERVPGFRSIVPKLPIAGLRLVRDVVRAGWGELVRLGLDQGEAGWVDAVLASMGLRLGSSYVPGDQVVLECRVREISRGRVPIVDLAVEYAGALGLTGVPRLAPGSLVACGPGRVRMRVRP